MKKENADPAADLALMANLSLTDRKKQFMARFSQLSWDDDVETSLKAAWEDAKALGLTRNTVMKQGKDGGASLFALILHACGQVYETQSIALREVDEAARKSGVDEGVAAFKIDVPQIYFERYSGCFYSEDEQNTFIKSPKEILADALSMAGMSFCKEANGIPSEIDRYLVDIMRSKSVYWAGPLAGYKAGLHTINGKPYLVTDSFQEIEPKPDLTGEHSPHIQAIVGGLFGKTQARFFMAHLKFSRRCLREGLRMGGMATLIAGEPGVGKTFLIDGIVKPSLGNRSANVYSFLTCQTPFNKEMVGSEVHVIDDGNPFNDREARRQFTNAIKQSVASAGIYCHAKGLDGVTLPLYRRLFVVTNTDSLDAMPEMEQSLMDKVFLFKANKFKMPMGCCRCRRSTTLRKSKPFRPSWRRKCRISSGASTTTRCRRKSKLSGLA